MPYNHTDIETKWIKNWSESNIYKTPILRVPQSASQTATDRGITKKKYILEAFPYPSGDGLHVGHALPMTAGDITSRYYRMNGYSILHPMGWDSFGLPTENFAKKKGLHPQDVTNNAIANFTKQIHRLGVDYDWSKELATSDPSYYKWTQWFFQLLYKRGLAYKKEALVNWDPVDMTVLANEQVLADGTAERSGAKVEQKMMSQWFFKITDYAERLLNDLDGLDWPESTKLMQKNWIGKSVGAEVEFAFWSEAGESHPLVKGGQSDSFGGITEGGIDYIPYNKDLLDNSRTLRAEPTKYEELVWRNILKNEKTSYKFNRQKPLLNYIVDFYCSELKLVIEIDGESHSHQMDYDKKRTEDLGVYGIKVLRFMNQEVNTNLNGVKIAVEEFIKERCNEIPPKSEILTPFVKGMTAEPSSHFFNGMTNSKIKIFTTRVDTIFGVTYLVLAPEHHLVDDLTTPEQFEAVTEYKEKSKQKSQFERTEMNKDKSGVFTGSYCINPFNGDKVPVWIGDYVLASYGTGAVMAVPAHDERDYEFALKYDLEIKQSIKPKDTHLSKGVKVKDFGGIKCFTEYGITVNSGEFTGLTTEDAKVKMAEYAESQGFGNAKVTYRLRDWSIGRQRYWGCPIPVVYDKDGNESLVPESDLPVLLPQDLDLSTGMIKPLRSNLDFINSGSQYGEGWTREGDTMDTFVCSSWYFFRYCSGNIDTAFANPEDMKTWMPVDQYIIGAEHSTMHLLYARFFTKVLHDAGYIEFNEPFTKMRHQGLILGPDGAKMSKSKGNVINPNEVFEEYGADTLRMYEMFMGPFDQPKPWSTNSIKGVRRFLDRVWNIKEQVKSEKLTTKNDKVEVILHKLIKKIGEDIETYSFNTCVSEFMKFVNTVEENNNKISIDQFSRFIQVLAPFAPFITEEIWNTIGSEKLKTKSEKYETENTHLSKGVKVKDFVGIESVHLQFWPEYDPNLLVESTVTIGVQINGKVRGEITLSPTETLENAQALVVELDFVRKYTEDKNIRKFVYVAGKIVNVVVG
jgi:leucyl-tRNA synthetase